MVEYYPNLDLVFSSLADPTRRDMLQRVAASELSVSELAKPYDVSLAAISKHLKILEKAKLIIKRRQGKQQYVSLAPRAFDNAADYLQYYQQHVEARMDRLDALIKEEMHHD